jgi:HEAT repeat protein
VTEDFDFDYEEDNLGPVPESGLKLFYYNLKIMKKLQSEATKTWKCFLNGQFDDNSKFVKILKSRIGAIDQIDNNGNLTSNVILLELARTKNYKKAYEAWENIVLPLGDTNHEVDMYKAAALFELDRKLEALKIVICFDDNQEKDLMTIIEDFQSGKSFAFNWAKSCKQTLELTADRKLLEVIVNDKDKYVRSAVAQNQNTPVALLEVLAKDKNEEVRSAVAQNQNTPVAVLEVLAKDKHVSVRGSIVKNQNTPNRILEDLEKDKKVSQFFSEQKEMSDYLRSVFRGSD